MWQREGLRSRTAYPDGTPAPTAPTVNYVAGQTVANLAVVALSGAGRLALKNSTATTNVIVDIQGYYTPAAAGGGTYFTAASPQAHVADTRFGMQSGVCNVGTCARLAAGSTTTIQITGQGGVPAGATAVVANFGVINTGAAGPITFWAADQLQPVTANVHSAVASRTPTGSPSSGSAPPVRPGP
ncbi:MAG: hypothetical protein QOI95_2891 [Acidimicrobiaceae bacterium]